MGNLMQMTGGEAINVVAILLLGILIKTWINGTGARIKKLEECSQTKEWCTEVQKRMHERFDDIVNAMNGLGTRVDRLIEQKIIRNNKIPEQE
jgi:hypothetical protein